MDIFLYGNVETAHLKAKDKKLAWAIDQIGSIEREVQPDIFAALVKSIVGQQISTKAQQTIWTRIQNDLKTITPQAICGCTEAELQGYGITFKKAGYIRGMAEKILCGDFDLDALRHMPDQEVCRTLNGLEGIGVWTAEMLMLFSMQRPNIVSYGDLAILRGMRMLYHHRKITRPLFEKYRKRYSPYGSVASLYLWAIAGGAIKDLRDYAPKTSKKKP